MELVTQGMAKSLGLTHYFTGKPCKRGHVSKRYTIDATCVECKLDKTRNPSEEKRVRRRELDKIRYAKNPEKFKERQNNRVKSGAVTESLQKWKQDNPEYFRKWYSKNAEIQREKRRQRWAENPEIYSAASERRRARKANAEGNFTKEDLLQIRESQRDLCNYCHTRLNGRGHLDHVYPLSKGGTNWPSNLQYLCETCNTSKGAKTPVEFINFRIRRTAWGR